MAFMDEGLLLGRVMENYEKIVTILFILSELLAQIKSVKSNSIFQLVFSILQRMVKK